MTNAQFEIMQAMAFHTGLGVGVAIGALGVVLCMLLAGQLGLWK